MENNITLQQLITEVKKMRELQKRFWHSKANNTLQQDARKKLLIQSKQQEEVVDKLISTPNPYTTLELL